MITKTSIYKYGIEVENIIIKHLEDENEFHIINKFNKDNKFDLIIKWKNKEFGHNLYKVEIKADRRASTTNNFYIEYISHNLPSGINTTLADILLYVAEHTDKYLVYWINIKSLKEYINTNFEKIRVGKTQSIDINDKFNGKFNYGYLIKISEKLYFSCDTIKKCNVL
jgi:hypothetical protein